MSQAPLEHPDASWAETAQLRQISQLLRNFYRLVLPGMLDHIRAVARLSVRLARRQQWEPDQVAKVFYGGLYHDVGYLLTPGESDYRGGAAVVTDLEGQHPVLGANLFAGIPCLEPIIPIVRHHHEHFDGSGFPDKLEGTDIPIEARLVGVVHSYDVLIRGHGTTRPMGDAEAQEVIREDAGIIHDPALVEAFIEMLGQERA